MGTNSNVHRPALFAEKISDPHRQVCPGGASRLEVCLMLGELKSINNMTEVRTASHLLFESCTC